MRRTYTAFSLPLLLAFLLTGCNSIGDKAAGVSAVYGVTAAVSLLVLVAYCVAGKNRDGWYLLLFASVLVVNSGYLALSVSKDLEGALLANRLAYLGSVFLPLAMWMIIIRTTHIRCPKWLPGVLIGLAVVVFLIAASPGYLPIYYREVGFERIDGVSRLVKVYGPLHIVYLFYLLGYFTAMVAAIIHGTLKDKVDSLAHSSILAVAVFVNIGVWLIEQLVRIDFEILSVSYIISELFLLGLKVLIAETQRQTEKPVPEPAVPPLTEEAKQEMALFCEGLSRLTPKEKALCDCYVEGMTTDAIMAKPNIKENTLKFHSKNLYGKLGVRSRKQLKALHGMASAQGLLKE